MIKVGRAYTAKNGQRFLILAKKTRPASNGCNYIGESNKTGVIAFFSYEGKHGFDENYNLNCDPYKWIGIENNEVRNKSFVRKEELKVRYSAYLRIEDDNPNSIIYVTEDGFYATYL